MTRVTANPFTTPVPMVNRAIAAINVVIFASEIVENALLYPEIILAFGLFPLRSSSLIRSYMSTLASTAIPTVSTIPAIPDKVNVAWNNDKVAVIIKMLTINAMFATKPNFL